jgi:DNA mismatch repair protein MutL
MSDIIKLLPDSVANQIAAGEVIQRPASVVKELTENAIDAGATSVSIIIKDAGRTLIQIIDNGSGMSDTDARMAFERHATSKITSAIDLFAIRTMGFRGEALASIAAIADVTLRTKKEADELGTEINIKASEVISQEPVGCPTGTNFAVKNLFFNVPARRKFLKTDSHELRLCITELQRVALPFSNIEFKLQNNNTEIYHLQPGNLKQRITQLFGKNINQNLIDIKTKTTIVNLYGFIGKPQSAKKTYGEQYFFVNNRFMKHQYFHKAIMNAYEKILPPDTIPSYFLFLDVNPENIDVNIHPTKTEIKFEDEQSIWQIIHASVKEALGKFNIVPSIDFNTEMAIEIPIYKKGSDFKIPEVRINPAFNPFDEEARPTTKTRVPDYFKSDNIKQWESLYQNFEKGAVDNQSLPTNNLFGNDDDTNQSLPGLLQIKNKYILVPVKSGLMVVDQKRAHERILFEKYQQTVTSKHGVVQETLFPVVIELPADDYHLLISIFDDIINTGFDIEEQGNYSVIVKGCPADIENPNPKELIEKILEDIKNNNNSNGVNNNERVAMALAKASAISYGKVLSNGEMRDLIDRLFSCGNHNYSPDGKPIATIVELNEIEKRLL